MVRALVPLALLGLAACSARPAATNAGNASADMASATLLPVLIHGAKGDHRFNMEVARTGAEQERGLMFRKDVAANGGMLFPFAPPRTASFWMKNTLVPLDMLFIRTDGTIAFIARDAAPYSLEPKSAGIPVAAVLELRGGRAAELGIKEEDKVRWGACAVGADKPARTIFADLNFCPAN